MTALAKLDRSGPSPMTVVEFGVFLDGQDEPRLFELVDGAVVMMSNPTETHNQIAMNIGAPLKIAMDMRRCRTYAADMRVQRSDRATETFQPRPDVVVRCGPHTGKTFITDPLVIVEVLSPSTMDIDRSLKLEFYKSLPTMCHVAIVYQDQQRIEHYRRTDTGWERIVLQQLDDLLRFEAVGFHMTLAEVYFGLEI
jgi:Uma2 family endonuclease